MKTLTQDWLLSAKTDIDTIGEILHREDLANIISFHSQQCVEKVFKAIIEEFEIQMLKTHNLLTLYKNVQRIYPEKLDEDILDLLNKVYTDSRYPSGLGFLPQGKPTLKDAKCFYEFAKDILSETKKFLEK